MSDTADFELSTLLSTYPTYYILITPSPLCYKHLSHPAPGMSKSFLISKTSCSPKHVRRKCHPPDGLNSERPTHKVASAARRLLSAHSGGAAEAVGHSLPSAPSRRSAEWKSVSRPSVAPGELSASHPLAAESKLQGSSASVTATLSACHPPPCSVFQRSRTKTHTRTQSRFAVSPFFVCVWCVRCEELR